MNVIRAYSNIKHLVKRTNLEKCERLSAVFDSNIYLKREDQQINRSFKIRGVCNKMINSDYKNVVCASAGNHAQGVAYMCNKMKINGDIFLPKNTTNQKISRIEYIGRNFVNINIVGETLDDTLSEALEYSKVKNYKFIHPFNDYEIIAGQGTICKEICEDIKPDYVITCVGGGGLISGLIDYRNEFSKETKIIGVEAERADSMTKSIMNKKITKLSNIDRFVDGAAVPEVGDKTYKIVSNSVDKMLIVSNGLVCRHLVDLYQEEGIVLEPAGALSLAGLEMIDKSLLKGKNVVCILSGGNNDITRYNEILENKLIYDGLKHYFIIQFTQKPGELKTFVNQILNKNDDIVFFEYLKKNNKNYGNVLIGIQIQNKEDINTILDKMNNHNYDFYKIDKNDYIYDIIL